MSIPGMGSDFQLFSAMEPPERRVSQADSMSFDQTTPDDSSQDWTQWMRWDDQQTFPESSNDSPISPFDTAFTSPGASSGRQKTDSMQTEFSPDISLDYTGLSLESFLGRHPTGRGSVQAKPVRGSNIQPAQSVSDSPGSPIVVSRKRKSGSDDDGSTITNIVFSAKQVPSKKRAHNVIEKRYRANLNEKIAELRDSVPSLRASSKQANGGSPDDDDDGITPASKLNKASILSKATEYIRHLEIRNKRLEEENTALKIRLRQLDKAADQIVTSAASVSSPSNCTVSTESGASSSPSVFSQVEDVASDHSPTSLYPPEGLIKVPDSFKRMRATPSRDNSFSQSYIQYENPTNNSTQASGGRRRSHFPNKYMLGALAGLMVLEGMGPEKKTESTAKGLLAVPLNLLHRIPLPPQVYSSAAFHYFWSLWHARAISHFLLLAILVVGSAFIVFVYLFNSDPRRQYSASKETSAADIALSSCNFRRQAWLTSIQRVGVPRHRFFHEWYVVTSRCFEYVLRCLLGWKLYSWVTGVTEEDERGRVKTWDIAIDAQLAGGDTEISKSRLVLTIFAAGTLPRSPMRMMLKALHCRILMWRVGEPGSWTFKVSNDVARSLARYQWDLAREMNNTLPQGHEDALPRHLAALLKIDSDDVMIDSVIQRAANLTWNRPTQEGTDDDEALLDVVEEDPAIQSSLDALAAWWSSHMLQRALLRYFEVSSGGPDVKKNRHIFKTKIKTALDVAPQPSAAHARALVVKAVFFEQDRVVNIGKVLAVLPKEKGKTETNQASNFLDSSLPISIREEISIAVRCAMIAAIFTARANGDTSLPAAFTMQRAIEWFNRLPLDPVELTLLEFAAVYHLLHVLASDVDYLGFSDSSAPPSPLSQASDVFSSGDESESSRRTRQGNDIIPNSIPNLGRVASELIYWARNAYNPAFYGFTSNIVRVIETECMSLCQSAGVDVANYSRVQEEKKSNVRQPKVAKKTGPVGQPSANEDGKEDVLDVQTTLSGIPQDDGDDGCSRTTGRAIQSGERLDSS
ncbi:basic helix-loop-helix domain-containing protein [Aspergillus clavatus NRRL 1]|uniref:HLH transcription factor, putative n=1 Tax=Aspergillus clavatus (strain ATCC 1007 / CBS 513.65 / DSM 816 / NCTC 3887 / NRRL 1 / QM 1276 / 107) TaxID=344612 RepID=A1CFV8_ASPCL|nr:HLH transcription factor, putative [Aspergillus clavatus NRRL 1]EAW11757.1 HLH transcription factor, putative [Aspergillus clavatus NRRL 1]